jgi:hypothetical protein
MNFLGLLALGFALLRELSGEARLDRAQQEAKECHCVSEQSGSPEDAKVSNCQTPGQVYLEVTEAKFKGVNRCC